VNEQPKTSDRIAAEKRWSSSVVHGTGRYAVQLCACVRLTDDHVWAMAMTRAKCEQQQLRMCDPFSHRLIDLREAPRTAAPAPTPSARSQVRIQFAESAREAERQNRRR
jgi:thiazole synthase ThiGH ThiG subunit